jgi:S1-C subfamily serine protease
VYKDLRLAATWYQKAVIANPSDIEARNGLARLQAYAPQIQEKQVPNQPTVQEPKEDSPIDASGTGFLIDKRGYLATNNHVTKGAKGISVCLQIDGEWKAYNAVLVKNDPTNDLSIIRIEDSEFKPFTSLPYNFTTEVEEVASDIYTLGYPQVHIMGTEVKYTTGAINSKSGVQGDPTHYQISAHIDHGNSGGPMFNSKGTIIGITDSGLDKAEFGDVNYAIKSSYLKSLVDALPVKLELPHDTSIEKLSRDCRLILLV